MMKIIKSKISKNHTFTKKCIDSKIIHIIITILNFRIN